ncbi:hypothetical protein CB0101_03060 [Synechococcus sp. CB0101]|uniref:hypothetical protein n=1 Tax=Synechococcus sp. CB0101 TaxID=232348 RepID=UPI00020030EF|nr:hypothetical protein [Synechococcus sp. CB0101]QCH14040.1 hypothetical protein CB0101_03060 [Synechococcus sp. CB0101]
MKTASRHLTNGCGERRLGSLTAEDGSFIGFTPMRRLFAALALICASTFNPALAQGNPPPEVVAQQQQLQSLLDDAIDAIRANNEPQACSLRTQAFSILSSNLQAFEAVFPANDWSDLQTSLQGSVARCTAKGY